MSENSPVALSTTELSSWTPRGMHSMLEPCKYFTNINCLFKEKREKLCYQVDFTFTFKIAVLYRRKKINTDLFFNKNTLYFT